MPAFPIPQAGTFCRSSKKGKALKFYHLNIGQPHIETPHAIMDAVRHADIKVLEYSHKRGNESYRRKLGSIIKNVVLCDL
jgi:aspartate aminotransferase